MNDENLYCDVLNRCVTIDANSHIVRSLWDYVVIAWYLVIIAVGVLALIILLRLMIISVITDISSWF